MSQRDMWKMMHLLYVYQQGPEGLTYAELHKAGIDCYADTVVELLHRGVIQELNGAYTLAAPARAILQVCTVGNQRWVSEDMWVDYPQAFVVMPFTEGWSDDVFEQMIEPAAADASLECVRADSTVRVGDLSQGLWKLILRAGVIIADVSVLNANVFYELGLSHALGKDTILVKRGDTPVPADFGGALYYEYSLDDLAGGKRLLQQALEKWADEYGAAGVKELRGR